MPTSTDSMNQTASQLHLRTGSGRAFTIVELLVVISIITLLLALLLPALGRARKSSVSTVCTSRMKQTGQGWSLYANENRGVAVPGQPGRSSNRADNLYWVGNGFQYRPRWYVQLGAASGIHAFTEPSKDISDEHSIQVTNVALLCPAVEEWTSTRNTTYGYNYQFLGNTRFLGDNESRGPINYPVFASSIEPSGTIMFADCIGTAAGKPADLRAPNLANGDRDPGGFARGGHGYALDPPRLTATSDFADSRLSSPEHRSGPDERHLGQANVAFCDGHIDTMTVEEMGYLKNDDGSIAPSGGDATNRLFSGTGADLDPPSTN